VSDDVAAKVAVKVDPIEATGDPNGSYRASELMTRFARQSVADARALRLWDDTSKGHPVYTLSGKVQFSGNKKSAVTAKVGCLADLQTNRRLCPCAY
jgi:hypothetical protein